MRLKRIRLIIGVAVVALSMLVLAAGPAFAGAWVSVPSVSCGANARAQITVTTNTYNSARWHTTNPDATIKRGTDSNGDGRIILSSVNKGFTPAGRVTVPSGFVSVSAPRCVSIT
jgi:hypothetical protein